MATDKEVRLTRPQIELLERVRAGESGVSDSYPPAKALVAKELCIWKRGTFGGDTLKLTDAGRDWQEKKPKNPKNDQA